MLIVDMKMPKKCIWYEDGQDLKCPLLDDNDCCRGQGNEANSAANDWDDLMKGCPIKGELVRCGECRKAIPFSVSGNRDAFCHCDLFDATMTRNDFCCYGERKEK